MRLKLRMAALNLVVATAACLGLDRSQVLQAAEPSATALAELTASEELLLLLTPATRKLGEGASALQLPNEDTLELFAPSVAANTLEPATPVGEPALSLSDMTVVRHAPGPLQPAVSRDSLRLWTEVFAPLAGFVDTKFFPIKGSFLDPGRQTFLCAAGLEALARTPAGEWRQIKAEIDLTWRQRPGSAAWEIAIWETKSLTLTAAPRLCFAESLDEALPKPEDLLRARHCQHEANIVDYFTLNKIRVVTNNPFYAGLLDLDSTFQHPSISAADVDGDGWDDLYLTQRWGRNMLLINQKNGTFVDEAGRRGLDIKDFCNCSIFADFDNDGDQDVFVGRSLEPSAYLAQENGRFIDRTREAIGDLPRLVSALAAADYNGDGLLDVYLCTYGPTASGKPIDSWAPRLCSPEVAREMNRRHSESHRYLNLLGPPNVLLKNLGGGKFAVAPESPQVADWHNTNQATWADFDGDSDPDLHVCNDFGPSSLYRNDGSSGFVNVTAALAGASLQGFGMGSSWGDYNGDARLDLYVSNMYSKAGRRITGQIPGLDPRTPYSADGSLLFRNDGSRFTQVAGTEPPSLLVAKVGWAFGGQFVDFDNDTWPDIYSPSGFYTAPKAIAEDVDL
ncbi:MAG: FG-GAP repeat domain-containing protein [Verrucomicrobiales bacterium]